MPSTLKKAQLPRRARSAVPTRGSSGWPAMSMTRFESRPARSGQWEYYFYIDIVGHPDEPQVGTALRALREACAYFKVLGTYPIDVH